MNSKNAIEIPLLSKEKKSKYDDENDYKIDIHKRPNHKSHFIEYLDSTSPPEKYAPRAPFLQWLTFTDMIPYIKRMNLMFKNFDIENMPNPDHSFNVEVKMIKLDYFWTEECKNENPRFYKALYKTFFWEIISAIALVFVDTTSKIYYSIYMGKIVSLITSQNFGESIESGELFTSAALLSVLIIISIFAKNWAFYNQNCSVGRSKLAISGLLYKKLQSTSITSLHEIKLGKVINLIGNDLNDMQGLMQVPNMVINPYMILLGTYMMWGYFGPSCLLGLASMVAIIVLQTYLSNLTDVPRRENKKTIDERVKLTHEMIEGIRLIKMYAWEKLFSKKIGSLRKSEHKTFLRMAQIDAIGRNVSSMSVYLNILVVCIAYAVIGSESLSPEKIFASMMILTYLSTSLVQSHQGRMGLVNFKMIMGRVEEVLTIKDVLDLEETAAQDETDEEKTKPVIFRNFMGYWNKNSQKPCLSNINLTFKPGTLTSIIGRIGSGKSTLLLSFLRELPLTTGTLEYSGKLAYVEQDPIIFSGTFRENVLFGRNYDETRYQQVLKDCRLDVDLQTFTHGDLTRIGERGVNLSGGQKARVSLARAFYSESNIYLLDDPFSALDSTVAREIFDKVKKEASEKNKTVILVTHHLHFAKESHHVVMMSDGEVQAQGKFSDLEKLDLSLLSIFKIDEEKRTSIKAEKEKDNSKKANNADKSVSKTQEKSNKEDSAPVTLQTYKKYLGVVGTRATLIKFIILFLVPHWIIIYYGTFLGSWAEDHQLFFKNTPEETFNHTYYILMCVLMLIVIFVFSYAKAMGAAEFFLDTNTKLHQDMIDILIRARTLFFDINPTGRILNRFSNDIGALDKNNPRMAFEFVDGAISHISLLITVCIINPAILPPALIVLYGLFRARKFFEKPLMLTKKLELSSKSPMLSTVPATVQGLVIIRAYHQGGRLIREFMDMVYNNAKTFTFLTKITRLFAFALDTPIQLLTILGIWIFISIMSGYNISPGLVGLSLMYLLKIGSSSTQIIRQSLQVDINMQSAQRMLDYLEIKSEAPDQIPEVDSQVERTFQRKWPSKGEITFNKIFLKYREELGFALKGLSLHIPGGLKVACVGRTGAGKSSIIQALFRMVEIEQGNEYQDSSIKVDGVDIGSIGLHLLRSRLSIIPQVPVVFAGTIKRNLDPFDKLTNDEIWRVLEDVGLKDYVGTLPNKLETDMTVSSSVFSAGQKQLMCLARVIISQSKVIILDEATANVDVETDNFIQNTIMEKFKDCTVLTIAHRLITIANYDKVVVIDNGCVAEFDSPYFLLVERIGDDSITKNGMFADMVRSTGKGMSQKIFEIAREQFYLSK